MRSVLIGVVALIFGLFLGGLPARRELEKSKAELVRVRSERERGDAILPLFLGVEGLAKAQREAESGTSAAPERGLPNFLPPPGDGPHGSGGTDSRGTPDAGASPETFETVRTVQGFRAAFARAAFVEKANLGPDTQKHLDETVAHMNAELARAADRAVQLLSKSEGNLKPRQMADLGIDILQAYRKADEDLRAGLDPATQAAMDASTFDLISQVDLGAFTKLQETLRGRMGSDNE